jgi:hypothetical protein
MAKKENFPKNSASIIEEVEEQLNKILEERKRKIEEELEEAINRQKEEARSKISEIESEVIEERESLQEYKTLLSDFEDEKVSIKEDIKTHLKIVMKLQSDIESLTGKSLEELKIIESLHKKLEDINEEASGKLSVLRKNLEEKYGIETENLEDTGPVDTDFDLDDELQKLNKIKDLLGENGSRISELGSKDQSEEEEEGEEEREEGEEEEEEEEIEEEEEEEIEEEEEEELKDEEESRELEEEEVKGDEEEEIREELEEQDEEEMKKEQDEEESRELEVYKELEKFRQTEGREDELKVVYFENEGKITLDSKYVIDSMRKGLREASKLYEKLEDTTSPKEHFFIKQEIIQEQENIRKFILGCMRVCEMGDCFFPQNIKDVFDEEKLKEILERVSMENWSNQDDFDAFSEYIEDLGKEFDSKTSPSDEYIDSILKELS